MRPTILDNILAWRVYLHPFVYVIEKHSIRSGPSFETEDAL